MSSGGKRKNSGRKPKYKEKTTTVAFRVPKSKAKQIQLLVNNKLLSYAVTGL